MKKIPKYLLAVSLCCSGLITTASFGDDSDLRPVSDRYVMAKNSEIDAFHDKSIAGILSNDIIPEGEQALIEVMSMPQNGVLELNTKTGQFIYKPNVDFVGTDFFKYALVKKSGLTGIAQVSFVVKSNGGKSGSFDNHEVTGGSTVRLQVRAGEVNKVYAEADGKRFRMRLRKGVENAVALFSKKCYRHRIRNKELFNAVPGEDKLASVVVEKKDGTKEVFSVRVACPKVSNVYIQEGGKIIVKGKYFGAKPKVFLLDEESQKLIKMKLVKGELRYRNSKGKLVCMDEDTGDSEAVLVSRKELVHSRYKVMLMNNIGLGVNVETEGIPELILE